MTFDEVGSTPDQEFELARDHVEAVEYNIKAAKFNNVSQLCIHFPTNFGADATKVYYIGLRGDFMQVCPMIFSYCIVCTGTCFIDLLVNFLPDILCFFVIIGTALSLLWNSSQHCFVFQAHREEVVIVNYELNANPSDHKGMLPEHSSQQIS